MNTDRERVGVVGAQTETFYWILNNAWVHPATGEYCAEEGGEVFNIPCGHKVGPTAGNFNHRDDCPREGHLVVPSWVTEWQVPAHRP